MKVKLDDSSFGATGSILSDFSRGWVWGPGHIRFAKAISGGLVGLALGLNLSLASDFSLTPNAVVRFADARDAAAELSRKDIFVDSLSAFDRAARKKTDQIVSEEAFLKFVAQQTLSWSREETEKITRVFRSVSNKIADLHLRLPALIQLVKTTGQEEGDAAYCRGNNIVLSVKRAGAPDRGLERLLTHELFHIWSRNNRGLRDSLYAVIGFKTCNEIAYPTEFAARKITNPDAPISAHYITVRIQERSTPVVPILFSKDAKYDTRKGGEFFAYLTFKLLVVEQHADEWGPVYEGAKPRLLEVDAVRDFHEQIGRNTDYIIHPEEILADNFVLLVQGDRDVRTPRILEEMRRILTTTTEIK